MYTRNIFITTQLAGSANKDEEAEKKQVKRESGEKINESLNLMKFI